MTKAEQLVAAVKRAKADFDAACRESQAAAIRKGEAEQVWASARKALDDYLADGRTT